MITDFVDLLLEIISRKIREKIGFVFIVFLLFIAYYSPQLYNKIIISTFNYVFEEKTKEIMFIINRTVDYFQKQNIQGTQ